MSTIIDLRPLFNWVKAHWAAALVTAALAVWGFVKAFPMIFKEWNELLGRDRRSRVQKILSEIEQNARDTVADARSKGAMGTIEISDEQQREYFRKRNEDMELVDEALRQHHEHIAKRPPLTRLARFRSRFRD